MGKSDIVLEDDHVSMVKRLHISHEKDAKSTIDFWPGKGNAVLGGGDTDGDLYLLKKGPEASTASHTQIQLSATGGDAERENRVYVDGASGDLHLAAEHLYDDDGNYTADVVFRPNWASLTMGGGAGDNSDGDIKLKDRDDNTRIHLTGGKGSEFDSTRIHLDGQDGHVALGRKSVTGGDADVVFRPNWASLTMGGGAGDNSDGDIKLKDRDGDTRIHLTGGKGSEFETTRVMIDGDDARIEVGTINIRGADGYVTVGSETDGVDGRILLDSSESGAMVQLLAGAGGGTPLQTFGAQLFGEAASLYLGGAGQEGAVHLHHADEDYQASDADRTAVGFVLKANKKGLEIADHDGNTAMRIDTDGTVRTKGGEVKPL